MMRAVKVKEAPRVDGTLSGPSWEKCEKSPLFVDMATGGPAVLATQAGLIWDDLNIYAGFWVEEPYPTAKLTERDSLIFQENDVEIFIDGGSCYYELEINALNTVYEMFFIWQDSYHQFDPAEFDVHRRKACTFGGDYDRHAETFWDGNHPRGLRWAFRDFDLPGLRTAVTIDGELNNPQVRSKGWKLEMALPWESLKILSDGKPCPPVNGDVWRIFLARFQKIAIGEKEHQAAWCVSPHGRYDTHMPEKFTPVTFVDEG